MVNFFKVLFTLCFAIFCIFAFIFVPYPVRIFGAIGLAYLAYKLEEHYNLKRDYKEKCEYCLKLIDENIDLRKTYDVKPLYPLPGERNDPFSRR